ncbi:adenylate/guanylate cyclase domain-containing protein [Paracoccaceae bacterium]|nr:adenylate/guanylate cyclase domain-containing protein [Paracoccaceae bacterium]
MSDEEIDRKIAVIFATDVVGYSKHMENDESGTVKNLRACEKILIKLFKDFKGRLFNTGGDSFLAEFPSAVSAVECAVAFQEAIQERNKADDTRVKLEFRIGINSGDVIKEKDNLLGDGVNIAARLEALAQTNGITISKVIYDYVKGKTKYKFNDLGLQKVKQNEFHAYDLLLETSQKRKIKNDRPVSRFLMATVFAFLIGLGSYFYLISLSEDVPQQAFTKIGSRAAVSSQPVILVYPFEDLGASETRGDFSAAFTESMISSLSRYSRISVLSSSTSMDAKTKAANDASIKEMYNADYVVRASIQTFSDQSRIQMQLTDLKLNTVIWTDKVDFSAAQIFEVQDNIGDKILTHLQINAVDGSEVKSWAAKYGTAERLTLFLNSRNEWFKFTPDGYNNHSRIIRLLEEQMGENNPALYNIKGWNLFLKRAVGLAKDLEKNSAEIIRLSNSDVAENQDVTAYILRALVEFRLGSKDCDLSKEYAQKAYDLGATVDTFIVSGTIWVECGDLKEGTQFFEKALRLQPNDSGWNLTKRLIPMYYLSGEYSKIIGLVEPHIDAVDIAPEMLAFYAFSINEAGDTDMAKAILNRAKKLGVSKKSLERVIRDPDNTTEFISRLSSIGTID